MSHPTEMEEVKPEDIQSFLRQYVPEHKLSRERDALNGRYRILLNDPLPALSVASAKAYAVRDSESAAIQLYALVFDITAMPRRKHITALKEYRHPNLVALLDEGVVEISTLNEARYVVVLERPQGQSLKDLLSATQKNPVLESVVINYLLRPFNEILIAFAGMGISHNRINLANVYIHNAHIQLGECVSEPSGLSQDYLFEPVDRILCSSWAKPEQAVDADCYALAVLALHLLLGHKPYDKISREDYVQSLLVKGSYHTLVIPWDISENFQDLFRALLNDVKRDRCSPQHVQEWLGGRRFNLILPPANQETARGFEFYGESHFNRKSLAQAMYTHWEEARELLFDTRLPRWLETGLHKKDVADQVSRIASNSPGDATKYERQNSELLTRIIIALDPTGPVRFRTVAYTPEGIRTLLSHFYLMDDREGIQLAMQAIEGDLSGYWIEQQKEEIDHTALTTKLQKMRSFLRMRSPGFGIERCLYDAHPLLACQSPLVKKFCILSTKDLLTALDSLANNPRVSEGNFMDAHIAAFLASKIDIGKEVRVTELDAIEEMTNNPQLVSIKLLTRAQTSAKTASTPGITHWIILRVLPLLNGIHRRAIRHKMQTMLQQAAATGKISSIASVMFNPDMFVADFTAFHKAMTVYAHRRHQIEKLRNPKERTKHARMVGRGLAQTLAYGTSLFTIYFTLRSYYHL